MRFNFDMMDLIYFHTKTVLVDIRPLLSKLRDHINKISAIVWPSSMNMNFWFILSNQFNNSKVYKKETRNNRQTQCGFNEWLKIRTRSPNTQNRNRKFEKKNNANVKRKLLYSWYGQGIYLIKLSFVIVLSIHLNAWE